MPITARSRNSARFNMVMLPQERAMLQRLAANVGLSESDVVRQLIRQVYVEKFPERDPGKPVARYNSVEARMARSSGDLEAGHLPTESEVA